MTESSKLHSIAPGALSGARSIAHQAIQLATCAARANLPAAGDDSHSNLGWDPVNRELQSHPLPANGGELVVGISFSPLSIALRDADGSITGLDLKDVTAAESRDWLDNELQSRGLKPAASIKLPYELPKDVAAVTSYVDGQFAAELSALAEWFDLSHGLLSEFAAANGHLEPGPSAVRCWPHHFDIATYVGLETGDFETARGVGVGMAPGDESYNEPYFYINPWPHLDTSDLPDPPRPGHWHTAGFVGAIATGTEILTLDDISGELAQFVGRAFEIGRSKLMD